LIQIATMQIPSDKLAAYNKGRRDEQQAIESLLTALQLSGSIDIATGHIIMGYLANIDKRPTP
jgi:hypothetical protein